ncbi:Trypsin-1 [Frankliniella fusca]|uniref:Trypsin-1 n=1 Tax=Frankliniella fusca TaxID=407009 RepID=A0AAE1LM68_9NEOP|nr:Trypsin-1 [Frankliniella fusca]
MSSAPTLVLVLLAVVLAALVAPAPARAAPSSSADWDWLFGPDADDDAQDDDYQRRYGIDIVGGDTADIKTVPYQVSVEVNSAHSCGGSVLSARWVLTAAHCTYGKDPRWLQVRAGTDQLQRGGSLLAVRRAVNHPKYVHGHQDWDVSVLELAGTLSFGSTIKAVTLPAAGAEPSTNTAVLASGWGLTQAQKGKGRSGRPAPNLPQQLRKVTVRVVQRSTCANVYRGVLTDRMICAAAPGKDTCTYDSGGPLVDSARGVQVGVVSWGQGCADPNYPGVYVHLGNKDVRQFIKSYAGV